MSRFYSHNLKKMPLSAIFSALGDPARLEIVRTLLKKDEISCGECKQAKSKSTMSHHFRVLKEAGLICKREEGTTHYISLRVDDIEARAPGLLKAIDEAGTPV
jgi:DNA-binding transcriptional ArsR family regulator